MKGIFPTLGRLLHSITYKPKNPSSMRSTREEEKRECGRCGKVFIDKKALDYHKKLVHQVY